MDYGGEHKVSIPKIVPEDAEITNWPSIPNPQKEYPINAMLDSAVDPLAGKSGKDSLSEEEAVLS